MPRFPSLSHSVRAIAAGFVVLTVLLSSATAAETPDKAGLDFFESKIRPMLIKHCYQCHSAKAASEKKLKGGLLVDSREGLLAGGESGPAVVPGKPADSPLLEALRHETFKMPPSGKLPDSIITDFAKWVEMGAPDPRDGKALVKANQVDIEAGRKFWSFQPLAKPAVPAVKDTAWVRTDVDKFIRAHQEKAGVTPNATANPRVLIRRVYFRLIGLPPSPAEIEKFAAEAEKDLSGAYDRLVDRLLASEHYGERWARHWLDLARFAESNGYAFDKDRPNAYHYRDFVIKALNADMPYDQFVRLQVAGDLLAGSNPQSNDYNKVAATGFLTAGPFTTQQTQKERERSRYEQLDDMIHTMGTSLLGLTIGCARCHTHKYDPLPVDDYYRLAAVFREVGFADVGINTDPQGFQQKKAAFDKALAPLVAAVTKFEQEKLPGNFDKWLANRPKAPSAPVIGDWHHVGPFASDNFDNAFATAFAPEKGTVDLKATYNDGKLVWKPQPTWVDGTVHNTLGGANSANYLYRRIEVLTSRKVALSLGSDDGIKVWINGTEILANKVGRGAAPDQEKIELPLKAGQNHLLMKIVNGGGPSGFYFKSGVGGPPANVAKLLAEKPEKWNPQQRTQVLNWYKTLDEGWLKLSAAVQQHKATEPKPQLTNIYAAKVRGTTYGFGGDTYKVYHLRRGNPDNKDREASPGFLQVLMDPASSEDKWMGPAEASSKPQLARVALADWLTDTDKGAGHLLARVIVNRLWQHHFGRGIVSTPSDFGTRGERPTHPELLDYLAGELIRHEWKLKPIHRLILTSSVAMQANSATENGQRIDPENLLLWRNESRRLEAEIIRDSLLTVSGKLDKTMYGKGTLDARNARRSVYLTVKRSRLIPVLQLFDAPDAMQSVGNREESTVAPQALAMLNSPLVRDLAMNFAQQVRPNPQTSLKTAVDQAYKTAYGRAPTPQEAAQMLGFIARQAKMRAGNETLALRDFCHVLLCANEFVYVD